MEKVIKENNFISAVIYIHNCEDTIYEFLKMLDTNFEKHYKQYELICVNDCSSDKSINEIKKYSKEAKGSITILNMSFYQGLELSMNAGRCLAIGDFVYEFDIPIKIYSFDTIYSLYTRSLGGYDIVTVSPQKNSSFVSNIFYKIYNKFAKSQYKIQTEYFRILSRRAINRINSFSKSIPYRKAVYSNCGLKVDNIISEFNNEILVKDFIGKNQKDENKETAINTLLLYTDVGYKFSMILTSLMMFILISVVIYTLSIYIQGIPIAGWTSTIIFLSFCFMGLSALFTITIKYLSLILSLIFTTKEYLIESIEKIK